MTPLLAALLEKIDRTGPISVAEYMETALAHPRFGYYRTRDPLGAGGDFTTAPEISQMFGELIGLWFAHHWQISGMPTKVAVAEFGPGRGTLMSDFLRAAEMVPAFRRAIELHLVETSPVLRARQSEKLASAGPVFHDDWGSLPDLPTYFVANEFVDALPVRQFVRRTDGWHERLVGRSGGGLSFVDGPLADDGIFPVAMPGEIFETCEAGQALARFVADRLSRKGGAALIIDYGHGATSAGETVQAVRNHVYHPVLENPGEADITAHVDFAALARAGIGARTFGPVEQGRFLTRLGIQVRAESLCRANPAKAKDIEIACRRLIEPSEMGTLFKAFAMMPAAHNQTPPGFAD